MKQTKQFLRPLLMAIVMLVGMLVPQGAWAQSPVTVGDQGFSNIQDAIDYIVEDWVDDATLTLHQDFTLDDNESIDIYFGVDDYDFNFTIDLNGHTITGSSDLGINGIFLDNNYGQGLLTVTIANSQDKKGKLVNCCLYLNQNTKVIVSDGVSLYPRFDLLNFAAQVCSIQGSTSVENYGDLYGDVVNSGGSFINNGRVAYVIGEFENNGDYCAYFNWADDGSSFSAYVNGGIYDYNEGNEDTSITSEVTKEPTCTEPGVRTFTGTFIGYLDSGEQEFTDNKEVEIPAGHDYQVQNVLWSEDYTTATLQLVCSRDAEHTANVEVTGEGITSEDTTPATCVVGVRTYTAKATYNDVEYTGTATVTIDPTAEHNLDEHNVCTECGHGFIFFEKEGSYDIEPENRYAFSNSEGSVEYIGNTTFNEWMYAFEFSGLVTEIGNNAFTYREALTAIYLPEVTTIGEDAFSGCGLRDNVSLPKATTIGQAAFLGCGFQTLSLPEATTIGYAAFGSCGNLSSIELPKATTIGVNAFMECDNLNSITVACAADLRGAEIPEEATITRVHDFSSKTLTAEPDADGLYAYACDRGCGAHSDDHIVKANNASEGESATIELTSTTVGETTIYTAAAPVAVPDGAFSTPVDFTATGDQVSIDRTFAAATPATINLPFDVPASAMNETYYTFGGIAYNEEKGKWEATMVPVDKTTGTLTANTPYIVMPTGTSISITDNTATVSFKADATANNTTSGDWTMTAAKADRIWAEGDTDIDTAYGFAASSGTAADGETAVEAGQFVRVAAGASIKAGRAYLNFNGTQFPSPSAAPTRAADAQLPASISVIFKHADATGIGTLNTETGAFTFDGWYDLQGHRVSEPAKGGVIMNNNKKIIVK